MPPKASARVPAAPAAEVEDVTTLIPCPVLTAHPNGFVERTEPERETHEVRCAPDSSPRNGPPPVGGRDRPPRPPRARLASPRALPTLPRASAPDLHTLSPVRALLSPAPSPRSAYKLGKKKRSYNQVELTFDRAAPGKCVNDAEASIDDTALNIYEATERSFSVDVPVELRDSALEYELKLYNGSTVRALIYLVYAEPLSSVPGGGSRAKPVAANGADHLIGAGHTWLPVTRARCAKGCTGPILSAIQRFGKQGRTQKGAAGKEEAKPDSGEKWKDARNLFISIDEASNHVCAFGPNKCKVFRYVRGTGTRATQSREYRRHQGPEDAPGGDCVAGAGWFPIQRTVTVFRGFARVDPTDFANISLTSPRLAPPRSPFTPVARRLLFGIFSADGKTSSAAASPDRSASSPTTTSLRAPRVPSHPMLPRRRLGRLAVARRVRSRRRRGTRGDARRVRAPRHSHRHRGCEAPIVQGGCGSRAFA